MFFFQAKLKIFAAESIVFHVWVAAPSWCQWHGYWHFWLRKYDGSSLFLPIILVGTSLNTWTKAWSYFLPHSFSATATGGICFGARNVLSQNENGLDLPCLKLEIARGKVAEKLHKKYCPWSEDPHLKLVLLAAKVGALLLPEVVGLDDVRRVDGIAKVVLEHLQVGVENGCYMIRMLTCNWKPWLFIGAEMGLNWSFELGCKGEPVN